MALLRLGSSIQISRAESLKFYRSLHIRNYSTSTNYRQQSLQRWFLYHNLFPSVILFTLLCPAIFFFQLPLVTSLQVSHHTLTPCSITLSLDQNFGPSTPPASQPVSALAMKRIKVCVTRSITILRPSFVSFSTRTPQRSTRWSRNRDPLSRLERLLLLCLFFLPSS